MRFQNASQRVLYLVAFCNGKLSFRFTATIFFNVVLFVLFRTHNFGYQIPGTAVKDWPDMAGFAPDSDNDDDVGLRLRH